MTLKYTSLVLGFLASFILMTGLFIGTSTHVYAVSAAGGGSASSAPPSSPSTTPPSACSSCGSSCNVATSGCCSMPGSSQCVTPTKCKPDQPLCADSASQAKNCDQNGCDLISNYLNKFINLLSVLVGLVVVASIIAGAIQYSSAGGDPQKVANARNRIRNALLALVGYVLLYSFLQFLIPGGLFHK